MFLDNNQQYIMYHSIDSKTLILSQLRKSCFRHNIKDKKFINEICNKYRLLFFNHYVEMSHILYEYTNIYQKIDKKNKKEAIIQRNDFYDKLLIYIKQFYPNVSFLKYLINHGGDGLQELFYRFYSTMDNIEKIFNMTKDINILNDNIKVINTIFKYYSIIEEFLIRYCNYSIVGISNQKYIITSCNNCDKVFNDYLTQGYSLIRLQKIYLVDESHYEFVPALPTKDIGYKIDEYIETIENNDIDSKRLEKII